MAFPKGSGVFRYHLLQAICLSIGLTIWSCQPEANQISYNQDIRPILNENCLACHGGIKQQGGFSLLFEEDVYQPTESGKPAIVPGNRGKSELFQRITNHDPELRMPQDADPLTPEQVELIGKWIDQGAKWETHWAFIPPELPEIPKVQSSWVKNNIDAFILEKLDQAALTPQPEADRETLIRRLSLDLIGLPPSPQEVALYLNDNTASAYENLVDRLMESPHFGEKWAALWLDLARYADSKGYEKDPPRTIWRYRDWVINAFNQDMPFDQFTIEQLAGDLLADPKPAQLLATAFNRNSMTNTEGGTEDEEFRVAAVIDRVNTTYEVWQSLTMACVQCHDHPYDPLRQEEYYKTYAFFNQSQDSDLDFDLPLYEHYSEDDQQRVLELIDQIALVKNEPSKKEGLVQDRIKHALFPTLLPVHVDEFHNVIIYGDGLMSNWSNNVNTQKDKDYYFQFSQVPFDGLEGITLEFSTGGEDVKIKVFQDSIGGNQILEFDLPFTGGLRGAEYQGKNTVQTKTWSLDQKLQGEHDLVFHIVNTTGNAPDGITMIRRIRLEYQNENYSLSRLIDLQQKLIEARNKADLTPVMKERNAFHRTTHVLERGNYLVPGEEVNPGVPSALPDFPQEFQPDRLGLAKWMVSEANPLTGRVLVNRLWEQLFGIGIVETVEDFGTQGAPPSHPELLDYLASRFVDHHQWSVKKVLKEMVMSATYRQSSRFTPEGLEKDPYNRLLSRGPRFRLSAEQIRDQALTVSGLLERKVGGESTMPPQPDGIWNVVYSNHKWETKPEDKYRRGLYTFWRRTTPYPSMVSFDSPSREFCVSRRVRTNTPLQALITLNDPVYLEASVAFAERMVENEPGNIESAIRSGVKLALSKDPDQETLNILMDLYHSANTEIKGELVSVESTSEVELNAMAVVANAIMNLDEFVTKE
jgi:hypothetical protein